MNGKYQSVFDSNRTDLHVDYRTCNLFLLCSNIKGPLLFTVESSLDANCRVLANDLKLGVVDLLDVNHDAASQIIATCTPLSAYTIGLISMLQSRGSNIGRMQDGAERQIGSGLFRNTGRSVTWVTLAICTAQAGAGSGVVHQFPVNGRVAPQSGPPDVVYLRIPGSSGQGFRFDPATHSNLIRPPIPGHPATLSG